MESDSEMPYWGRMDNLFKRRHRVVERIERARWQILANNTSRRMEIKIFRGQVQIIKIYADYAKKSIIFEFAKNVRTFRSGNECKRGNT